MDNSILTLLTPHLYATLSSLVISAIVIVCFKLVNKQAYDMRTKMLLAPLLGSVAIIVWASSQCFIHWLSLNYSNPCHGICDQVSQESVAFICTSFVTLTFAFFGLAISSGFTNYFLGDKITVYLFHAKPLAQNDAKRTYETLNHLSRKIGVQPPKLYLIERSTPMILTVGNRRSATIIVSVGLLETLSSKEVRASLAHEISHIKNNDGLIKTLVSSLKLATPLILPGYLLESAIHREREFLADEDSVVLTNDPSALASALMKVSEAWNIKPNGTLFQRLAMGFFLRSPTRSGMFSKHPPLEERLNRLLWLEKDRKDGRTTAARD